MTTSKSLELNINHLSLPVRTVHTLSVGAPYVLLCHRLRSHRGTENYTDVTEIRVMGGLRDCSLPTLL